MTMGNKRQGSISIGGSVSSSVLVTGDRNSVNFSFTQNELPEPANVDIQQVLAALEKALATLESSDRRKIDNAIAEAKEEAAKAEPDKDEIGKALGRALEYAKKSSGIVAALEQMRPALLGAVSWLGQHGQVVLNVLGFA